MKSFDDWYFELFESGNGSSLNQQEIAEEAWDFRQAEIDELRKRLTMYEREGYKLVPVEPTKDMLNSGYRVKHDKIIDLGSVYKAMIGG